MVVDAPREAGSTYAVIIFDLCSLVIAYQTANCLVFRAFFEPGNRYRGIAASTYASAWHPRLAAFPLEYGHGVLNLGTDHQRYKSKGAYLGR